MHQHLRVTLSLLCSAIVEHASPSHLLFLSVHQSGSVQSTGGDDGQCHHGASASMGTLKSVLD